MRLFWTPLRPLWDCFGSNVSLFGVRYTESLTNKHPRTFACRQDYTTYWLLVQMMLAGGKTIVETSCGGCGLGPTMWTAYTGLGVPTASTLSQYGIFYAPGTGTPWNDFQVQDMFAPSVVGSGFLDHLCPDPCTLEDLFRISSPTGFVSVFGSSTSANLRLLTTLCTMSQASGGTRCGVPSGSSTSASALYIYNVVVETAAFFMRFLAYHSADASTLTTYLTAFTNSVPLPSGHVLGSGCDASELMSEWRVRTDNSFNWGESQMWAKTPNFTFFRGGLPHTRLVDLAGSSYGKSPPFFLLLLPSSQTSSMTFPPPSQVGLGCLTFFFQPM